MMLRRVMLVGCLAIAFQGAAVAAPQANELGKAWPNAQDVSRNPRWHVYVFERDGVRYIQINDLRGHVHGAFATIDGAFLVLPMGSADMKTTSFGSSATSPAGETIYSDTTVVVRVAPQANGHTVVIESSTCTDPARCSEMGLR